ncbi:MULTISPECIES: M14 family metallopeptidase [Rhodopseudomonas]|uniref:Deacylase n=1 Tax=Rhodopseudomonas palustris TaxID=1076 RepID=A0A0D7E846_RHOPL|nr:MULTISPECIES: M14 family metallopeptidase [Rhodopseudomonas]KIZ37049.1 deacylase [Rhodopseudomonas palustris]MDF3810626.1 M14 family metallopeptidase [Rhodopseudomonas sp. BAL398]WOK16526.1 M14 family metallopeptidase [Rhodopseudomonas sp. BAL398]
MSAAISNDFTKSFALDYAGARAKFIAVASELGAALSSYKHPGATGPNGAELFIDVARLGDAGAPSQLVILSGTHGLEGLSGSAAQIGWMQSSFARALPRGVSALLVHALNPFGFANGTRTTENNVDLNRNFIDHGAPYPANPGYAALYPELMPRDWNPAALAPYDAAVAVFQKEHGPDALFDAQARGQYQFPEGTNYGGDQREWSNLTLETIVADHLGAAQRLGFIDWHTGIGDWADSFFLCFNDEAGPLHAEAVRWWGKERIVGQKPHSLARPNYQGLVFHGMTQFLGARPMVGAVIEFGTRGMKVRRALRLDQWLKFKAEPDSERVRLLRADLQDCFVPVSSHWREETTEQAISITQQAVDGLASWSPTATTI